MPHGQRHLIRSIPFSVPRPPPCAAVITQQRALKTHTRSVIDAYLRQAGRRVVADRADMCCIANFGARAATLDRAGHIERLRGRRGSYAYIAANDVMPPVYFLGLRFANRGHVFAEQPSSPVTPHTSQPYARCRRSQDKHCCGVGLARPDVGFQDGLPDHTHGYSQPLQIFKEGFLLLGS